MKKTIPRLELGGRGGGEEEVCRSHTLKYPREGFTSLDSVEDFSITEMERATN